jgi:hypothetical protein
MRKYLAAGALVSLAVSERLWFDLGPNVELVMLSSLLAGIYLGRRWGVAVALLALALSDMVLGNTAIMIFTWSAFAIIGFFTANLRRWQGLKRVGSGAVFSLGAALFFYLYTNFGVWLIGGLYPKTWAGLKECYWMGLPFLRIHAFSSLLLLSGGLGLIELVRIMVASFFPRSNTKLSQVKAGK